MEQIKSYHIRLLSIMICLISFILTSFNINTMADGYRLMLLFPIIYTIGLFVSAPYLLKTNYKVSVIMYFLIQGLRFVVSPPFVAFAGNNCGSSYIHMTVEALREACLIMIFEYIICTFFLIAWTSKKIPNKRLNTPSLTTNWLIYIPYLFLAFLAYFYFGRKGKIISFITLSAGTNTREGDLTDTALVFGRQIVLIAIVILFLAALSFCKKKYDITHKNIYVYLAIVAAIVNVCVIVGERRTTQIYTAFCCTYCLCLAFPQKRKEIVRYVVGAAIIVITLMSIYKVSYAFLYSSYIDALAASNFSIKDVAQSLQAYFNGPQNVAVAVTLSKIEHFGPLNFIYDIARSTVPINFLVKNSGTLVSFSFNNFIYGGSNMSGHLLSSVGAGYLYFGIIFCFLIMLFNIRLAMLCERFMKKTASYEMIYIWGYLLMRFSYGYSLNLAGLLNSCSIMLITGGLLFGFARLVRIGKV